MRLFASFRLAAAGLALLAAGCGADRAPVPSNVSDAREQAARRGVPVLIDFYTDW
jgi:hypothetical protein